MNVLVAGDDDTAFQIAEALMVSHQVTLLVPATANRATLERLDVEVVTGTATDRTALDSAGVAEADHFVASTSHDEQNLVACLAARRLGAKRTTCVLNHSGSLGDVDAALGLAESLGIDSVVRPAEHLTEEIVRIVTIPGALDVEVFGDGRVLLVKERLDADAPVTKAPLKAIRFPPSVIVTAVDRGDELIVPTGNTRLQAGDNILLMGLRQQVRAALPLLRHAHDDGDRRATIVGAGTVGAAVAEALTLADWKVTVVEADLARCEEVAGALDCLVLHGDGADLELLEQEGIGEVPVLIAVTNNDEKNLLISLLAKNLGVERIITRADRISNERMFEKVGIDVVLSTTSAASRSIVRSIERTHADIIAELEHGDACVMELELPFDFEKRFLRDVRPPKTAVVGAVFRRTDVLIPRGDDELRPYDRILVFCQSDAEDEAREYFLGPRDADEG